jgi:hypothetical protein
VIAGDKGFKGERSRTEQTDEWVQVLPHNENCAKGTRIHGCADKRLTRRAHEEGF